MSVCAHDCTGNCPGCQGQRKAAPPSLADFRIHPMVDTSTADDTAHKREDGSRITVGQVAEAQARLLDLIHRRAIQWQKSGNPARRASGDELRELLRR